MKSKNQNIRRPIMLPVAFAIFLLTVASLVGVYYLQEKHIGTDIKNTIKSTEVSFYREISRDAELLNGLMYFLKKDEGLKSAWQDKDREKLLSHAAPIFDDIKPGYRVTHFYFTGIDRICFLRVHNPQRYGDYIGRESTDKAEKTGKPAHGIELGKFATFTLRVVHPWFIEGKLSGYMELGMEIEHITPRLSELLNSELLFIINKDFVSSKVNWEEGLKMMGKGGNWNLYRDYVVIDSTPTFPEIGNTELSGYLSGHNKVHIGDNDIPTFRVERGNAIFSGGFIPLFDMRGDKLGEIVLLKDVSIVKSSLNRLMLMLLITAFLVGLAINVSMYIYLGELQIKIDDLLEGLSERNAVIESDLDMAREVQERLLPSSINVIPGLNMTSIYKPFDKIGGDYYDVVNLNNGSYGILLADATGHGVPAAFLTVMVKVAFVEAARECSGAADTMTHMGNLLSDIIYSDSFLTAIYIVYTPASGKVAIASAGHHPSLYLKGGGGECSQVAAVGLPLGVSRDVKYDEVELNIDGGDRLILFTDGLFEGKYDDGTPLGSDALEAFVRENSSKAKIDELAAMLTSKDSGGLLEGVNLNDDIALIVIEKTSS